MRIAFSTQPRTQPKEKPTSHKKTETTLEDTKWELGRLGRKLTEEEKQEDCRRIGYNIDKETIFEKLAATII